MVNFKKIFWTIAFLLMASPAISSVSNDWLVVWIPMNESSGNLNADLAGGDNNATVSAGNCTIIPTPYGYGRTNPTTNCRISIAYSQDFNLSGATNWSMMMMVNYTTGNGWLFSGTGTTVYDPILFGFNTAGEYASTNGISWNLWTNLGGNLLAGVWICQTVIFNGTHYIFYKSNTTTWPSSTKMINWPVPYFFYGQGKSDGNAVISQYMLFKNRVLTSAERNDLCANHSINNGTEAGWPHKIEGVSASATQKIVTVLRNAVAKVIGIA